MASPHTGRLTGGVYLWQVAGQADISVAGQMAAVTGRGAGGYIRGRSTDRRVYLWQVEWQARLSVAGRVADAFICGRSSGRLVYLWQVEWQARLSVAEWAKVIRAIAHNLELQAEDARRNQAQIQRHHDQRLVETQDQRGTADESKPELQEDLQRLQKALAELHLEVERRELLEKVSSEELTGKLQHSEALLSKAGTELKERHTKARACENQLKQAQKGVMAPKQQRDYVNELDTGYRVLKSGLGGGTHITEPDLPRGLHPGPHAGTRSTTSHQRGAVWLHIQQTVVPPYTKGGAVWLHIQCGQTLNHMLGSLTLSPKAVNDQTNALAKTGTRHNNLWSHPPHSPTLNVAAATRSQRTVPATDPTLLPLPLTTKLSNTSIRTVLHLHSNPFLLPFTASGTTAAPSHRRLHGINHMLRVKLNMLKYAPDDLTTPKLVMSQGQKGGELIYAYDTSGAKHHGTRTTDETLKQVAHWPSMQQDVAEYVRGCQVCCQVQTANANRRAPLQHRGVTFPWSVNQKDWTVQFPLMLMAITDTMQGPTRVSPTELVTAWQVTLTLHRYQPGDSSLITAYSTHQHLNKLRLQLREQLATQSQTLQTICKYWKGIVVVPCTHSFLLIQTVNSMKQLFTDFQNDFAQNQLVMALMTDLLREFSFSMDRVAMNRILQYPMQTVLDFATDRPTRTVPAHLANFLGAAILLHVDPKQNEVAVLLNLPSGEPDNISRPKDKVNVRWWQCNTHAKKHTSDVIAYHNSNPRLCLAPHFCRRSVTKDFQYFCPNQLFLRNHTEGMGRLLLKISDTRCPAEAKPRTQVIGTQAKIVGDRWLVNTPLAPQP
ncbi:hypothetical protein DPX16_9450 [Anabarilius grahami]|uniref:Integrase zinc-binding domain-containing protein n=1 Tax=Anabarilius grahami TaxID=495550 RepID=A0A3N0Z5K0_ANAGA|nr:hypothetical protein DPX16_9450 [Anabarilius grahami]